MLAPSDQQKKETTMIPSLISSPHSFQLMVFDGVKNMKDVRRKVNAGEISASLVSTSVLCHSLPLLIAIEKSIQNRTGVDNVERWVKKIKGNWLKKNRRLKKNERKDFITVVVFKDT